MRKNSAESDRLEILICHCVLNRVNSRSRVRPLQLMLNSLQRLDSVLSCEFTVFLSSHKQQQATYNPRQQS